jgi:hypothetical protein
MNIGNYLRTRYVQDFIAPLMTLKIIEGEVDVLEHRSHCAVSHNYAAVQCIAEVAHVNLSPKIARWMIAHEQKGLVSLIVPMPNCSLPVV